MIDNHEIVVRFNGAHHCGVHGRRTDVLVIGNLPEMEAWQFNRQSLACREIWSMTPLLAEGRSAQKAVSDRPITILSEERARAALIPFKAAEGKRPSTGAVALAHVLHLFPRAPIALFGFHHYGTKYHDWEAERLWCAALERDGKLVRLHSEDNRLAVLVLRAHLRIHRIFVRSWQRRLKKTLNPKLAAAD